MRLWLAAAPQTSCPQPAYPLQHTLPALSRSCVQGSDFSGSKLVGVQFARAQAQGAVMRGVDATDANCFSTAFDGADLEVGLCYEGVGRLGRGVCWRVAQGGHITRPRLWASGCLHSARCAAAPAAAGASCLPALAPHARRGPSLRTPSSAQPALESTRGSGQT